MIHQNSMIQNWV